MHSGHDVTGAGYNRSPATILCFRGFIRHEHFTARSPGNPLPVRLPIWRVLISFGVAGALMAGVVGCQTGTAKVAPAEPPAVPVSQPVQREVTDYMEFTGQTKAVFSNDIIPQVTGYLVQMPFKEGDEVKKGDLLFEVDPRPYKAQLDQARAKSIYTRPSSSWPA